MEQETLLSAGIDIGTTTTHLMISRIGISVVGGFGTVPRAEITSKEILYESPVYFTPLTGEGLIDGRGVANILETEYANAYVQKSDLQSGAVIITGESSRKENARQVLQDIAALAGSFVAAQAGSSLESYLAGRGSGADTLSAETGKITANVDIGGGTTNIAVFQNGECVTDCCLRLGGRLIKTQTNGTLYVSEVVQQICREKEISLTDSESKQGKIALCQICRAMAELIWAALGLGEASPLLETVTEGGPLNLQYRPQLITFSGGVAACMGKTLSDFEFGDIGVLLARAVEETAQDMPVEIQSCQSSSPIRATVIGAGQFSMEVSGSTIHFERVSFPMRNLPCIKAFSEIDGTPCAVCLDGEKSPGFQTVEHLAETVVAAARPLLAKQIPLVVLTKHDFAMALGLCLRRRLPQGYPLLCADGVACKKGDYIDIGQPLADGRAVPVIVKTLVFGG